ncbi:hypothetical protein DTL21_23625 [Bremerella cremea]|uniref:Anaphase-promoting complex subunit 4-like WD40 domain-containing protein n=1 Tax=Blastopirellula marina TaxID=124 RepID=A0A2S8FDY4_9BACT|nr:MULTISPECIES: hypothetical protein [Pirellulaceae]PQO30352.1 hypothetical protein C5Y83_23590 [Blastopirellula marina]RCS43703.1 hypothetical protein DTL21_23625 [Bremerella cremea]
MRQLNPLVWAAGLIVVVLFGSDTSECAESTTEVARMAREVLDPIENPVKFHFEKIADIPLKEFGVVAQSPANGGRLLFCQTESEDVFLWDVENRKKLWTLLRKDMPENVRSIAISPDGAHAAIGYNAGKVAVLDGKTGEVLITHQLRDLAVITVGFTYDGSQVFGADMEGFSFITPLLQRTTKIDPGIDTKIIKHVLMAATSNNRWWKVLNMRDRPEIHQFSSEGPLDESDSPIRAGYTFGWMKSGPNYIMLLDAASKYWIRRVETGPNGETFKTMPLEQRGGIAMAFDRSGETFWRMDRESLEVYDTKTDERVANATWMEVIYPGTVCYLFPDEERMLVTCKGDNASLWQLTGDRMGIIEGTKSRVNELIAEERFDVIEEIARRWNGQIDHFRYSSHETPTSYLIDELVTYEEVDLPKEERNSRYLDWIASHAEDCQFMRLVMFHVYYRTAYLHRGNGPASTVTEKGAVKYEDYMKRAWEVLEPIFDQEDVPAEAYTCAIMAGKNFQWEPAVIESYLRASAAKWPKYHRTYSEEAVARLPRWGGEPGDTARFASKMAENVGGDEGDILYAQIFRYVSRYTSVTEILKDPACDHERFLRGMFLLGQQKSNHNALNLGIFASNVLNDAAMARKFADKFLELDVKPSSEIWPRKFELIDKAIADARKAKFEAMAK